MSTILVTGAAGTIGRIITSKLLAKGHKVIAFDHAETALFYLMRDHPAATPVYGSIRDRARIEQTFEAHEPDIVVHAAAMKHVGMCAAFPTEAVLTNVDGTRKVSDAARARNIPLVLISTDKAVRPTTTMGQTKAVAEAVVFNHARQHVVRLVNIWASAGSLVEVVQRQIAAGEPVTVTDPDFERFFMTDSEAADLILQAVEESGSDTSHCYVAEKFTRWRVGDIVAELIARSGRDIPIQRIPPHPTEKQIEEIDGHVLPLGERSISALIDDARSGLSSRVRNLLAGMTHRV